MLHAEIGLDNLPPEYGGTSKEPYLPGCALTEDELKERLGFQTFSLSAGGVESRSMDVKAEAAGAMYRW